MQTLAFLWFEIQGAQQYVRETIVESHVCRSLRQKQKSLDWISSINAARPYLLR